MLLRIWFKRLGIRTYSKPKNSLLNVIIPWFKGFVFPGYVFNGVQGLLNFDVNFIHTFTTSFFKLKYTEIYFIADKLLSFENK